MAGVGVMSGQKYLQHRCLYDVCDVVWLSVVVCGVVGCGVAECGVVYGRVVEEGKEEEI